jgi:riboflavin biosynthesis pyrimidine reductase
MRTMHNGIMIGIETLLNDDPLLNGTPCSVHVHLPPTTDPNLTLVS